jgi:hypothetical protein
MDENERLLKALLIVALLGEMEISARMLNNSLVDIIHMALLLSPDTERKTCEQLSFLEKVIRPGEKL